MSSLKRKHEDLKRAANSPGQTKLLFVQPVNKTKEVSIRVFLIEVYEISHKKYNFLSGLKKPNTNDFA